ncbi:nitroreductase [Rhodobacterales bacterium 52_120_T64]|nr:nitroreductase [Rhodobacterales bacterium 52_120_T64]
MSDPSPEVLDFLLTRRSRPAKTLVTPVPTHDELAPILTAAARTPDHGKLEPWRFIVLEGAALQRLAEVVVTRGPQLGVEGDKLEKARRQFADAELVVAVVSSPVPSPKVPEIEQILSAGAVCLSMLNAALASGWGANWLTGWMASDRTFLRNGLSLSKSEFVAGFIHIGTERIIPPERPRPNVEAITSWVSE